MKKLKHSKYRNTGLIFELLSRKLVQETLANSNLKALKIITKHFSENKPLAQELKLYAALTENKINSQLVEKVVDTVENVRAKLDEELLDVARYNLVRDIKKAYGLVEFFNSRTESYPKLAAAYKFLQYRPEDNPISYVENRNTIVEIMSKQEDGSVGESIKQWQSQDPDIRKVGFSLAVDYFNKKYNTFLPSQKALLKEYIINDPSSESLRRVISEQIEKITTDIQSRLSLVEDLALKVKLKEGLTLLSEIKQTPILKDNQFNAVLKMCQLQENLKELTQK